MAKKKDSSSVASAAEGGVAGGSGGGGGGSGHAKSCGRCGGGFSIFFNKRVRCGGCDLAVCRKCAPWSAADKAYVCGVCSQPAAPTQTELESPNTQADAAQLKEVEENVRAHIEALVEGQVGGPLDHVNAVPNLAHSKARDLFTRHHGALSRDITALKYSLQMSILNRPLPPEDLPTSRHAHLSERIKSVKEAMILPVQNEAYDPAASPETPVEDFNSHTYEDILATAILNKVLESCEGERPDEVTIEVSHEVTSTDTDSGMSGGAKESRRGRLRRGELSEGGSEGSEERSLTPPRRSRRPPTVSPDQGVVTDDSWAQAAAGDGPPLQFKIEEHVEEITTHHLTDDDHDLNDLDDGDVSDSGGSWRGSRCSLDDPRERRRRERVTRTAAVADDALLPPLNIPLPDPSHLASRRVSFPELGADIVHDSCSDTDCCQVEPGDMVMDSDTWEENWLFRRQRLVPGGGAGGGGGGLAAIHDAVTMLIPNPEAHVLPTVGNRDVDELSELSEQHSLGSGEPWSTSESEGEGEGEGEHSFLQQQASRELSALAGEIVAEFGQKDQEYTVDYSVPSRVSRSSGGVASPPHAPSHRLPPGDSPTRASHPQYVDRGRREGRRRSFGQGEDEGADIGSGRYATPTAEGDGRCDAERPVPKPRKLSLATASPGKHLAKSPTQYLPSPSEDLSILSPPLEVPSPKVAVPSSDTVWFVAGPEDCAVTQGRTLRLVCQVNTKRPMGLSWYHNGALIPPGARDHWQWRQGSYHHLHVFATTHDTAGLYAAAAYTANTCVWAFCRVHHKSSSRPQKRPSFTKGLSDVVAEEGGEVTLQCQVTGHPEPRVTFSRGSERLETSSKVFIESDQYGTWTVKLSECAQHDSGEIVASASNFMGTVASRCHVSIVPEGTPILRDERDSRRALSSSAKADHASGPSRRHGSHKARSSGQASTSKHSAPASANTSPQRVPQDPLMTTSSGVTTDADDLDEILQVPTKPGTIAEREHRKWEAAIPLANNPYAPERLVQRLSHSRSSSTTHIPRALRVDFPEDSPKDLDPSLRAGVPPQADLKRYSRDYYVAAPAGGSGWHRSPQAQHVSQQPQPRALQPQLANGHHVFNSRSTSDLVSSQVHIRLTTGVSESAGDLKKAYPAGATGDLLQEEEEEEEEDSSQSQEGGAIRASRRTDWKDELRDIQAARVEREVARFQRTIDETQRRWEENYARAAPRSVPATGHSDSSTEGLHNPRPAAYLVPPRHDLWRTVSVDTLGEPARDRTALQPLLRHTSVDNLRPSTKVSNLSPLGPNPRQNSMNTVSSLSNINLSNNCGGSKAATSYQSQPAHGQSVESMSGYSDGESHGDGNDSDVSASTPDKVPVLPSVRKLASKFDVASRERVNDLDKHGKDGSLAFNGKKNIFIEKSSPTDPPYIRNLTNNLNKRTEKTYNVKEVRSLSNRSNTTHDPQPASDTDTYFTDHDDSEFDDQATVTSVSLPPTPHSLNGGLSYSTPSLLDSDSCYSLDSRDQGHASPGDEAPKTIFGVTLRKVSPWSGSRRSSVSSNSGRTNDESSWHNSPYDRQNSYSSSVDLHHERTPISETDSDSEAPNALRQVTIIKIDGKAGHEYQSMTDLSVKYPREASKQRRYSSTLNLTLENDFAGANQPVRKTSLQALPPLQPLSANSRQKSMPNLAAMTSIAFAPKGRKRSMREFLRSYQRQTSLSEINRIEEKVEEEWNNQRNGHVPLQRMTSAPAWNHNSFHEEQNLSQNREIQPVQEAEPKHETSPVLETEQTQRTDAVESLPAVAYQNSLSSTNHISENKYPSYEEDAGQGVKNVQHESDDESSMSDSTITSDAPEQDDAIKVPMERAKSVSDLLKLYTDMETKAGRPPSRISRKELFGSQDLLCKEPTQQSYEQELMQREFVQSREQVRGTLVEGTSLEEPFSPNVVLDDQRVKNLVEYAGTASDMSEKNTQEQVQMEPNQNTSTNELPSPDVALDDAKVKDFLEHIETGSYALTPDSANGLEEDTAQKTTEKHAHKKPLAKARSISDLLKLYSDKKSNIEETPLKQPTRDSKEIANKTIITLSDNEQYPKVQSNSAKVISVEEPVSVHRSRGHESIPLKPSVVPSKANSFDQPDSRALKLQQDLRRSSKTNSKTTRPPTSGSVPSEKPVLTQSAKLSGELSRSNEKMNGNVTNQDRNGNSIYEGGDNRTVISVSDNSPHSLFHASIINIDSEDSGYSPAKYPSYSDAHHYPPSEKGYSKELNTAASLTNQDLFSTSKPEVKYSQVIPIEMDNRSSQSRPKVNTEDTNDSSVQVSEAESRGPHVTVISLIEAPPPVPPSAPPPAPPSSDESSEEDALCDPLSLTKMIVHGSRCGSSSNRRPGQRKKSITSASVPLNSPFSPVRRKPSLSPDGTVISPTAVTTSPTFTDAPLHKAKLGPQYSFDEGVDLTLSDADLAQSAISTESKSTSSVDTIGKDSPEPRVHSLTARCVPRRFREGLKEHPANGHVTSKTQPNHTCPSPRRDAPSPEHLGIPWGPAAIPVRPTQVHGDTSDDSSAPPGSPRRVPRRRSGGRRDTPGWYARPECGSLTDPAVPFAADSVC